MKPRLWLAVGVAALCLPNAVGAQEGQGKFITEASSRLTRLIAAANKQGYNLPDNTFSVGGGWLKQGKGTWVPLFTVPLEQGKSYRFLAAGDMDAKDVDIEVQDAE